MLERIQTGVYSGDVDQVTDLVRSALAQGIGAGEVLQGGLIAGMDRVGVDFKAGDLFVPEVLMAARTMQEGMNILRPSLGESKISSAGKIVIGTVKGDLHDIGKNLVKMMFEGAGFEVVDLGTDVGPEKFLAAVQEHKPKIVGMSALLTTTMNKMKDTIEALEDGGMRESVKVVVGGAPVTEAFAKTIGADGYAGDAATAVDVARKLVK
jgi:5-methyltetrahydrofolate--homocysteine methyltransferase